MYLDVCVCLCYLTWHDYPSLIEWENRGILLCILIRSLCSYCWQINLNIIYTIIFMCVFWCVPCLSHWIIIVIFKPLPILSHSWMQGVFFHLLIRCNRVRGVMIDHAYVEYLPYFVWSLVSGTHWLLIFPICSNIYNN